MSSRGKAVSKIYENKAYITNTMNRLQNQVSEITKELNEISQAGLENKNEIDDVARLQKQIASLRVRYYAKCTEHTARTKTSPDEDEKPPAEDGKSSIPQNKSAQNDDFSPANTDSQAHFGMLDIRVGKIVSCVKHHDADSLYVEQVDVGDAQHRTIVSGLVNHVPLSQMQDRMALFVCNMKPMKMRGTLSSGMILCAKLKDKVNTLIPPANAAPGDVVLVQGFKRDPPLMMNPKKKIFERVAEDLGVNEEGFVCYLGIPLTVNGEKINCELIGAKIG